MNDFGTLVMGGSGLVAVGAIKTAAGNFGRLGGTLCLHSTAADPDGTAARDFFDARTDFRMQNGIKSPVYYHHGLDKFVGVKALGDAILYRDSGGVQIDEDKSFISLDDLDGRKTYERAERGELGWSSGTAAHLVKRTPVETKSGRSHHIDYWPLGLDASLTPAPAEKRNIATAIKSLIEYGEENHVDVSLELSMLREKLALLTAPPEDVDFLKRELLKAQLGLVSFFLGGSTPTAPSTPEPDTGIKKRPGHSWETQPRDETGKWTDGGGKLNADHVAHVMRSEGITEAHHHEKVAGAIAQGKLNTRKDVLAHLDAIHGAKPTIAKERDSWMRQYREGGDAEGLMGAIRQTIESNQRTAAEDDARGSHNFREHHAATAEGARQALTLIQAGERGQRDAEAVSTGKLSVAYKPAMSGPGTTSEWAVVDGSGQVARNDKGEEIRFRSKDDAENHLKPKIEPKPAPAPVAAPAPAASRPLTLQEIRDRAYGARDRAYEARDRARNVHNTIIANRNARIGARPGGMKRGAHRSPKKPAGHWITMRGRHVFVPEKGATADHVFAAGVMHGLSEDAHKELEKQYDAGQIETTAHLHLTLAEAVRAKRRGFTDVEAIREGVAHHGVDGIASHAQKFRAARDARRASLRAAANADTILARHDRREQFRASGKDIKDYVFDHAGSHEDAQAMAADLGFHSTTWDDDRNVTRRAKNARNAQQDRSRTRELQNRRAMAVKSLDALDEQFDAYGELIGENFEMEDLEQLDELTMEIAFIVAEIEELTAIESETIPDLD
jgi:hypothetical protein